jgi:hypothetical protein
MGPEEAVYSNWRGRLSIDYHRPKGGFFFSENISRLLLLVSLPMEPKWMEILRDKEKEDSIIEVVNT